MAKENDSMKVKSAAIGQINLDNRSRCFHAARHSKIYSSLLLITEAASQIRVHDSVKPYLAAASIGCREILKHRHDTVKSPSRFSKPCGLSFYLCLKAIGRDQPFVETIPWQMINFGLAAVLALDRTVLVDLDFCVLLVKLNRRIIILGLVFKLI